MEIRRADSAADRRAVMAVWHAATQRSEPLGYHQALRLALLRRHEGTWWMLEEDGRVLSSLMCYPFRFASGQQVQPAYGLGAVASRPESRRLGNAATLCRHAIEEAEREGRAVGLLFTAIPPAYYERLGFGVAPAWHHVCDAAGELAASGPQADLVPLDPRRDVPSLLACYQGAQTGLHVFRDEEEWRAGLVRNPSDVFFGLGEPVRGYVRLNPEYPQGVDVVELMVPTVERATVLRTVAELCVGLGRTVVEGWFDPVPELASLFEDRGRAKTQPMLRGVAATEHARFWGSDYF